MYHISDIKKFIRCPRYYFSSINSSNPYRPYLRSDENIVDLIKQFLGIEECFTGERNDPPEKFFEAKKEYDWFVHPRFAEDELRINVPFIHKTYRGFDLYFVYYGTQIKDLDLISYRICTQVLKKQGIPVSDIFLIYMNGEYVNKGVLEPKKLFLCTDTFKGRKIFAQVIQSEFDYESVIARMKNAGSETAVPEKNRACHQNGLCEFYDDCFPDEQLLEDDSILTLVSSQNKNRMYEEGIRLLKDADPKQIEGNKVQYAQIMASRNGGLFCDILALKQWLKKLNGRPISFIDFEWDRYLIPAYREMRPLDVLCFEFALYYIDENGHMEHRTFVSTGDCRREFVEALLEYLPEKGPILAYNATGAECLRLQELGEAFPMYKERLDQIISRFTDLAVPFVEGYVYDIRMQGNFTLKRLVNICSTYSYDSLDIYDGMEAVYNWRNIDKNTAENGNEIIENLKEYCSLDAYGLFLVYKWLIKLVVESE